MLLALVRFHFIIVAGVIQFAPGFIEAAIAETHAGDDCEQIHDSVMKVFGPVIACSQRERPDRDITEIYDAQTNNFCGASCNSLLDFGAIDTMSIPLNSLQECDIGFRGPAESTAYGFALCSQAAKLTDDVSVPWMICSKEKCTGGVSAEQCFKNCAQEIQQLIEVSLIVLERCGALVPKVSACIVIKQSLNNVLETAQAERLMVSYKIHCEPNQAKTLAKSIE